MAWAAMSAASMLRPGGHTKVTATQGQAICPLLCSLCHLCCLILQYCKALQLPILATWQLTEAEHIDS